MPHVRAVSACSFALLALAGPRAALGAEVGALGGEVATVDVTNTGVTSYRFDNRNTVSTDVRSQADDDYGELIDRLNVQANWWRFSLGLRLDSWLYHGTLSRGEARRRADDADYPPDLDPGELAEARNDFTNQYLRELHSRYLRSFYPAKLWLSYNQPGLDVTVGDFYAQLGRGLVLSFRKIDELAVDTTSRGVKLVLDHDFGPVRAAATLLGGVMNPSRIDEVSGRRLHGQASPLFFGFPTAGELPTYSYVADPNDPTRRVPALVTDPARPSYLLDRVLGGRLEASTDDVQVSLNGAVLFRTAYDEELLDCEDACPEGDNACVRRCAGEYPVFSTTSESRLHSQLRNFGAAVSIPSIARRGDLYVEVVGQQLRDGRVARDGDGRTTAKDRSGHAVYVSASARGGPVTANFEGKHYRTFFPLAGNVDITTPGFLAPELDIVAYNQPPTAEPIYVQAIGSPNLCVTGGRGRVDYRFAPGLNVYSWVGHYVSATEMDQQNVECEARSGEGKDLRTRSWDVATGLDLDFERQKSHARVWVGARVTDRFEPRDDGTTTFYREGYIRYDLVKHLAGAFSLQAQGWHRKRIEPDLNPKPWVEGENYTSLQWAPHMAFIFGYEYLARAGCFPSDLSVELCHYVSGGLQWRSGAGDRLVDKLVNSVSVFVGQRRGAIRCVSGVCRFFPPFEGARLELVSRF